MSLFSTLQTEKAAFSKVRTEIQDDNAELQTFTTSRLPKLQEDLVIDNSLMDTLAVKTVKIKVIYVQLSLA